MALRQRVEQWLLTVWYGGKHYQRLGWYALLPLTALFCVLSAVKRWRDLRHQVRHAVPVMVVGNITVGGTGKTPLVIALVERLQQAGFKPAVVSRGFGRHSTNQQAIAVQANAAAATVGDEPLLIVQRTGIPLYIHRQRNCAIAAVLQQYPECNVIISDDGLQHYRMGRSLEIAVVDGSRQFGNGYCLPAGPLRETLKRLDTCDFVVVNAETAPHPYFAMRLQFEQLVQLSTGQTQSLTQWQGKTVHAVTGIGNPQRFVRTLETAGLHVILHAYPDHHAFTGDELRFADALPVIMTEKDAVKCRQLPNLATVTAENCWYLPITAVLDDAFTTALLARLSNDC